MPNQKRKSNGYTIEPFDNLARFHVSSDSRPDIKHVVDVTSSNGLGECSCENFQFRIKKQRKAGNIESRCNHLEAARFAALQVYINALRKIL